MSVGRLCSTSVSAPSSGGTGSLGDGLRSGVEASGEGSPAGGGVSDSGSVERSAWAGPARFGAGVGVWRCRWFAATATWQGGRVTDSVPAAPPDGDAATAGPTEWLTLSDVAERLGVPISKVHQMIRDRELLAVCRDDVRVVPAELVANRTALKHLPGILTLLHDAGYSDEEALRWLYVPDATLPGTPAEAIGGDRAREVKRRAQALGF